MQLNNKVNGDIITIDKIDINRNEVVYSRRGVMGELIGESPRQSLTPITTLLDGIDVPTNYTDLCLDSLKSVLSLSDYVKENDEQNWLSENKAKRFFIPVDLVLKAVKNADGYADFRPVIDNLVAEEMLDADLKIIETTDRSYITVYANSISDSNLDAVTSRLKYTTDSAGVRTVIDEQGLIVIEDKLS